VQRKGTRGGPHPCGAVGYLCLLVYLRKQLMPGAHQQPLLLAMQEKAQGEAQAASSICSCIRQQEGQPLLLGMQAKAPGGATFAFGYASTLCPVRISKGGNRRGTRSAGVGAGAVRPARPHPQRQHTRGALLAVGAHSRGATGGGGHKMQQRSHSLS
jgi:hypothetical protein